MTEQFEDQGGFATSDPSPLMRWLTSRVMTRLFKPERIEKRRVAAERQRRKEGSPHRVEYFHQIDDGYSHLAAQKLAALGARYDVELQCHLVNGPRGKNVAEPELLDRLSRYDAHQIAPAYGLEFPAEVDAPAADLQQQARAILAGQSPTARVALVAPVSHAVWQGDWQALAALAAEHGCASDADTAAALAAGDERRAALKHYSGAMFYCAGEWYWGVDRLYHLEQRLAGLALDRRAGEPLLAPRQEPDWGDVRDNGSLTLELYASLRSPYTAVIFDRAVKLAQDAGVNLQLRPVLPMVMRGVPATREKGMYIFMDAAREARAAGVPYGNFYDPIGDPARRCYSLYPWAAEQGRSVELVSSFLRHAFALGINTRTDAGLKKVVEAACLDWGDARAHLGSDGWQQQLEANRLAMYDSGLWGVPSFRLLDANGEPVVSLWGQDRLWVVAREIRRLLAG